MFKRLYNWMINTAESPRAVWILGLISFAESSFFPIAPDVMLIPMCLARRDRAFWYATVCGVTSVLGGAAGYAIGYFLFQQIGHPILDFYGYEQQFETFAASYNEHGFWWVFASGWTPLPYKIFTIASGVTHLSFMVFISASVASRLSRYLFEAALIWKFGPAIHAFLERRLAWALGVGLACLIGGFVLLKYMF